MADLIAHPWMQGEHATPAQVKKEFEIRHQRVVEQRHAESEMKKSQKQKWSAEREIARGDRIGNEFFFNIDSTGPLEETKDPTVI